MEKLNLEMEMIGLKIETTFRLERQSGLEITYM